MIEVQSIRNDNDSKTAFVFSGGGSLGAVQVGMLKALTQADITPDLLVGASVGAINAAYFAGNPTMDGALQLEKIWLGIQRRHIFPVSPVRGILALASVHSSFVSPNSLKALIQRQIAYANLEDANIPLHVVTTHTVDGSQVVLSKGAVTPALLASTAIPGVFPPVEIDGQMLVDGGVTNNTPLLAAIHLGARRIIILPTGSPCALSKLPNGPISLLLHSLNLMVSSQLIRDIQTYSDQAEIIVVPPLCPITSAIHDFSNSENLIRLSMENTSRWLAGESVQAGKIPNALHPHHHETAH